MGLSTQVTRATDSIVFDAGLGKLVPYYFSGTNCRAWGLGKANRSPVAGQDVWLRREILKIGGETVRDRTWPDEDMREELAWGVVFDSTHFPNGTSLKVEYTVIDNFDREVTDEAYVPVTNNALSATADVGPSPYVNQYSVINGKLLSAKYTTFNMHGEWTPTDYFNQFWHRNAVFVTTHGSSDRHEAGNGIIIRANGYNLSANVWVPGYLDERVFQMGPYQNVAELPPFNTSESGVHSPPINLLYIYACHPAASNALSAVMHPFWNAYNAFSGTPVENQAFVGFTNSVLVDTASAVNTRVLHHLVMNKKTVSAMRVAIREDSINGILPPFMGDALPGQPPLGPPRLFQVSDMGIYGDAFMRLRGVYTGDNVIPTAWYR